jgi:very-short-patch-repair endonuclease
MPVQPYRPSDLQWRVFRGTDAVRGKLLTRHQLRSGAWVRLRNDVYADARLERDHELACRAAALVLPPNLVLAGPSAAYLHGVEHAAGPGDEVHVLASPGQRVSPRKGLRIHVCALAADEFVGSPGLRRTSPVRTAWDLATWLDPIRAVCVVDGLLALGVLKLDDLHEYVGGRQGSRGWRRAVRVASLADGGAQSPPESVLRVRLVLAGLPKPVTQHPIPVAGGMILHPDLGWPEYRVAVEYDGRWHGGDDRLDLDRERINQLVRAGWKVVHVTSRGLNRNFPQVVADVRAALISRGWRP